MTTTPPQDIDPGKPALLLHAAAVEQALAQIRALCDGAPRPLGSKLLGASVAVSDVRAVLDAVPLDATPPQGIDRDALVSYLESAYAGVTAHHQAVADRVLALVRPVEGVTLSLEEIEWLRPVLRSMLAPHPAFVIEGLANKVSALAARLEARS